jgi:hypothetical protein
MLSQLDHRIFGLESIKELYATDVDFKDTYENYREGRTWNKYVLQNGLLYRANKLCVPASFVCLLFLQEAHGGGLMGHFGVKKTDGQTEVINHILSNMLRAILKANLKLWEECLSHIEFAYNRSVHSTMKVSLF